MSTMRTLYGLLVVLGLSLAQPATLLGITFPKEWKAVVIRPSTEHWQGQGERDATLAYLEVQWRVNLLPARGLKCTGPSQAIIAPDGPDNPEVFRNILWNAGWQVGGLTQSMGDPNYTWVVKKKGKSYAVTWIAPIHADFQVLALACPL